MDLSQVLLELGFFLVKPCWPDLLLSRMNRCTVSCSNAIFVLPELLNTSVKALAVLDIADGGTSAGRLGN